MHSYWKWPSRNSGFTHWKWWFSSSLCKRLPGRVQLNQRMVKPLENLREISQKAGSTWTWTWIPFWFSVSNCPTPRIGWLIMKCGYYMILSFKMTTVPNTSEIVSPNDINIGSRRQILLLMAFDSQHSARLEEDQLIRGLRQPECASQFDGAIATNLFHRFSTRMHMRSSHLQMVVRCCKHVCKPYVRMHIQLEVHIIHRSQSEVWLQMVNSRLAAFRPLMEQSWDFSNQTSWFNEAKTRIDHQIRDLYVQPTMDLSSN